MGQKVNPHGFRVGIINNWSSRWFAKKNDFADALIEDQKIRKVLLAKLKAYSQELKEQVEAKDARLQEVGYKNY